MSLIKSLWASVQGDPVFMRRINGWLTVFWIVMIPVSIGLGWLSSVKYVSALSLWALVSGHWSAWQAARVEVKQDEQQPNTNPVQGPRTTAEHERPPSLAGAEDAREGVAGGDDVGCGAAPRQPPQP